MTPSASTSWRVRHEGSPQSIDSLTVQDVVEGLEESRWEPTDEIRGPSDTTWTAIENHPQFEQVAADLEPRPEREPEDPGHVDMNALIDVCLVLLVFFILTTSYAALMKTLDAPEVTAGESKLKTIPVKDAKRLTVAVTVKMEGGKPVYLVEGQRVEPDLLTAELKRYVGSTGKTILLLEYDGDVPHGAVVKVHDTAKGAGMTKVMVVMPKQK